MKNKVAAFEKQKNSKRHLLINKKKNVSEECIGKENSGPSRR